MATQSPPIDSLRKTSASHLLLLLSLFIGTEVLAQGKGKLVDQREQAEGWYVPVIGQVYADGKRSNDHQVILYKDNELVSQQKSQRKVGFFLELDIDAMYTIRIVKPGFQDKMMYIDTTLPKDLVTYPDYELFVNLLPPNAQNIDPFYTDFPSAIVRWNDEMGGFYHSDHYLTHIQTKLAGIASATF